MWARRYEARIVRRWIALFTSSRLRYMCAQLYGRRCTPEGFLSLTPEQLPGMLIWDRHLCSLWHVHVGVLLPQVHRTLNPYSTPVPGLSIISENASSLPRNFPSKRRSFPVYGTGARSYCISCKSGVPYVGGGVSRHPQRGNSGLIATPADRNTRLIAPEIVLAEICDESART
jgi:hypothetical protein